MHELGIASSVLEAVRGEMAGRPGQRAVAVGLRIGELAGVDADSLRFGFDCLVKDSEFEPLRLEIEQVARRQRCLDCRNEFLVDRYTLECPGCGSLRGECLSGDELDIAYLELEES